MRLTCVGAGPGASAVHLAREGPCFLPQTLALHPELHPPEPVRILHPPSSVRLHQGRRPQVDVQHGCPAAPVGRAPLLPGVWCGRGAWGGHWRRGPLRKPGMVRTEVALRESLDDGRGSP